MREGGGGVEVTVGKTGIIVGVGGRGVGVAGTEQATKIKHKSPATKRFHVLLRAIGDLRQVVSALYWFKESLCWLFHPPAISLCFAISQ